MTPINTGIRRTGKGAPHRHLTAAGFKFRYAGAAFLVVLLAAVAVTALLFYGHNADTARLGTLAEQAAREGISPELEARASSIAAHAADSIAGAVRAGDAGGMVRRRLQPFMDDPTVAAIVVTDRAGAALFRWQRPAAATPGALTAQASVPVRMLVENIPGAATPATLATLELGLEQAAPVPTREPRRSACRGERRPRAPVGAARAGAGARRGARGAADRLAGAARDRAAGGCPHPQRRAHRPGRLHPPGRGAAARCVSASCSRRSSACAGGCASRPSTRTICTACSTA